LRATLIEDTKTVLYAGIGILERIDEPTEPLAISYAVEKENGDIEVEYVDGSRESFPPKQGSIVSYTYGVVLFSTDDGEEYALRQVSDLDGEWISELKIPLPVIALQYLLTKPEETVKMAYLEDELEKLIALKSPDNDNIISMMYLNRYGAFVRVNESWVSISPADSSLDGTVPYTVNADTAQEFVDIYDKSEPKYSEVQDYLTPAS
jgi:hypothetical protein